MWTEGPLIAEFVRGPLHPFLVKQLYECSSKELMDQAAKSVGLHFTDALIDQVHDTGLMHERNLVLRATNKELRLRSGPIAVAAIENLATVFQSEVDRLKVELEASKQHLKDLEQEANTALVGLQEARDYQARLKGSLEAKGLKDVAAYKASRGFESSLEKMGCISYEFGYRVALEHFWGEYQIQLSRRTPLQSIPKMQM
ncbi:hypothetical protein BHM03_00042939 [Ensete ventricosum]|nr:hypothetical protein BHM03_00042939 [Ensete ventricosum]